MGRERRLILENFVEEELGRLGARAVDDEGFHTRLLLRLRCESGQDRRHGVLLARTGFPECRYDEMVLGVAHVCHWLLLSFGFAHQGLRVSAPVLWPSERDPIVRR